MAEAELPDTELLTDWLNHRQDRAFHALVERYAGLVHMAATRTCGGDQSLAGEVSQLTFIALAQKARTLVSRKSLAGWLHVTAVMHSKNLLRKHQRETKKRQLLQTHMELYPHGQVADDWKRMQPVLDEALAALSAKDREALLLRFYRSLSVREVATNLGIATDAAQKRLDRATKRLRSQLARRGCLAGGTLTAAMLFGLGSDAKAAVPAVSKFASNAIAASTAGGASSLTLIAITIMTQKATIAAGTAVLLAGAVVFIQSKSSSTNRDYREPSASGKSRTSMSSDINQTSAKNTGSSTARSRSRPVLKNPELAAKYGESLTNLSKHITENVVSLLEDTIQMGQMAASGQASAAFGGPDGGLRIGLGRVGNDLQLTDEQREKARAMYQEFQKREVSKSQDAVDRLKRDPTSLMQLMLAGDAFARGEIDETEYERLKTESGEELDGVLNPLDERNFRGGRLLQDEAFQEEFKAILDPGQAETFQTALDEQAANRTANTGNISNLPTMPLEKLDATIESVKKLTTGFKSVMEGFGGLKENPLGQPQPQAQP